MKPTEPAPEMLTEDVDFLDLENQVNDLFNFKKPADDDQTGKTRDFLNFKPKPKDGEKI